MKYFIRNIREKMIKKEFKEIAAYALLIAIITAFMYGYIVINTRLLIGNDGYFHIRFSERILNEGIVHKFPQIYFSELRESFYDKHFLYHIYQIPFIVFTNAIGLPLIYAAKFSAVMLIVLLFVIFYLILIKWKAKPREAFLFSLLFAFSSTIFAFRIIMPRAITFGIIFFLITLFFILNKDWKKTLVSCYLFALGYFAFPITLISLVVIFASQFLAFREDYIKEIAANRKVISAAFFGIMAGIIINPFFPTNIIQGITTDLKASIFRAAELGNAEWNAITTDFFFSGILPCALLLIAAVIYTLKKREKFSAKEFSLFSLALFLLILSAKSVRILDFFVPAAMLFSAIFIARRNLLNKKLFKTLFAIILVIGIVQYVMFANTMLNEKQQDFSACAKYIKENYQERIIFNSTYDDFPQLYYYLPSYYFIAGLDEYYLYDYSKELFNKYRRFSDEPSASLLKDFNARIVFVDLTQKPKLGEKLQKSSEFKREFEADDCMVFKVVS
ncbi:MAG: hypothetical protein J7L14_02505 [Candidatus Diapherotrites archaeon]|nr:hypothetical protein [Candidatus Diapherotrites archaeon]